MSKRNELEHRRRGIPHRCLSCRRKSDGPSREEVERFKRWWLGQFSLDELRSRPALW